MRTRGPRKGATSKKPVKETASGASKIGGVLRIGGASCVELADCYGTPLYVTDEGRIRENYRRIWHAFANRWRNLRVYYAVKANANLSVLSILRQEGAGADCSGVEEARLAMMAGFRPDDILLTASYINATDLKTALALGVRVNLDDASALDHITGEGIPAFISMRINPGVGRGHHAGVVTAGRDSKFGMDETAAVDAYEKAKALGIRDFGIHMMAGSGSLDADYFGEITKKLLGIADEISTRVGIEFSFVDLGGGFGIPHRNGERPLDINRAATLITDEMKASFGSSDRAPVLAIEPGRYIVGDSTILLARVRSVKRGVKTFVGIDAGMNTFVRPALYGAYHEILLANRGEKDMETVSVCGTICENTDLMAKDVLLPKMEPGDLVAILNAGAYGFSMSSQYNTNPRPAEALVLDGTHQLTRERETLSDVIGRQHVPPRLTRQAN
ncbi:MAG: diaminopimelate decarboxylase [Candidatus Thermoplasmatota archaeon]|nr:diaminopimelate decarboxylase [Candidatus Thermoplasmatota archaeon]